MAPEVRRRCACLAFRHVQSGMDVETLPCGLAACRAVQWRMIDVPFDIACCPHGHTLARRRIQRTREGSAAMRRPPGLSVVSLCCCLPHTPALHPSAHPALISTVQHVLQTPRSLRDRQRSLDHASAAYSQSCAPPPLRRCCGCQRPTLQIRTRPRRPLTKRWTCGAWA